MGRLGGLVFAGLVARIEGVHQVIAGRAFARPGRRARPPGLFMTAWRAAFIARSGAPAWRQGRRAGRPGLSLAPAAGLPDVSREGTWRSPC